MTIEEKWQEYERVMHQMQAGVAMQLDHSKESNPKHLRTGVNSGLISVGAVQSLLIKKGIITEEELVDSLIEYAQKDVDSYTNKISDRMGGVKINLV